MKTLMYKYMKSPVGLLQIVVDNNNLVAILWENERLNRVKLDQMVENKTHPLILEVEKQLNEYFHHQRTVFDLPLKAEGTAFQQEVWRVLKQIPYGTTWSYKDVATNLHRPEAVRAVGSAIGRNPISIVVPCHRVIGSNGSLTGFAGGMHNKKTLLDLEHP